MEEIPLDDNSKKITELTVSGTRPAFVKDSTGKRRRVQQPYSGPRQVKTVSGGIRFAHYFVDGIVYQILAFGIEFGVARIPKLNEASAFFGSGSEFLFGIIWLASYPLYFATFEHVFQKTPAKFLTGSWVINEYGEKPSFQTSLLRSIIRLVPFEAFSFFGDDARGWHDSWSKTWVVNDEELGKLKGLLQEQR